jgi:transcriptional regulator with XRE-family HTH domain
MGTICKKFGLNVRQLRIEKGYSQEKFAELAGLHRTYISDIELGKRNVSLYCIEKVANALNIEAYKLFVFD